MQINYAVADESGRINSIYSSPYRFIECGEDVSDVTHFMDVATYAIKPKKALEPDVVTDGLTATITGLPSGLTAEANGLTVVTDDQPLVVTFDVPGTYEITLSGKVEYLDESREVTVGDA